MGRNRLLKRLIFIALLLFVIGSTTNIALANQDIKALFNNWLNTKTVDSIEEIEQTIAMEQTKQTARLKQEIKAAIQSAKNEHEAFIDNEKYMRVKRIEAYTNTLIANYQVDTNTEQGKAIVDELECIVAKAKLEMENVVDSSTHLEVIQCDGIEVVEEAEKESDELEGTEEAEKESGEPDGAGEAEKDSDESEGAGETEKDSDGTEKVEEPESGGSTGNEEPEKGSEELKDETIDSEKPKVLKSTSNPLD